MKDIALNLHLSVATHVSGTKLVAPLLKPNMQQIVTKISRYGDQVANAIQSEILAKGHFSEFQPLFINQELTSEMLEVLVEPSPHHFFPELKLTFHFFYHPPAAGSSYWVGFVPMLQLTAVAEELDSLKQRMRDSILLEFIRHKRLANLPALIQSQWFQEVNIHPHPMQAFLYTLSELEEMRQKKEDELAKRVFRAFEHKQTTLVGMEESYDQLVKGVKGGAGASVIIIGESGKGKTELIRRFVREREAHGLTGRKVWQATAAQLIHQLTALGSWEDYLAQLCNELRNTGDLLYIPNLADLFEVGQYVGNSLSLADYLRDYISRGDIMLLTECTPEQASQIELRAPGYLALFQEIRLPSLEREQLEKIVISKSKQLAKQQRMRADEDAAIEILRLQQWFTPYSGLPGKTIVFLDSLFAEKKKQQATSLSKADIYQAFCQETGLPQFMIHDQLPLVYEEVSSFFRTNIYGQNEAIDTVLELLYSIKAAVIKRGKPLASLLFVGPTGVGKTEMAKVLANFLFGQRDRMIRFDMSEYADLQAVMRLTGDTGMGEGLLTATVRQNPFSVILFDELEKVHHSFYDLLLQILGEGRLTDARGRVADFCSTIIIMTSNIGARDFQTGNIGFSDDDISLRDASQYFQSAVQSHFRPELFNRLDRVIAFAPLQKDVIRLIVDRELAQIQQREGFEGRDLVLSIDKEVRDFIGEKGYNARYGARFLQRTLREKLIIPLSHRLNEFAFNTPLSIHISLGKNDLSFDIQKRKTLSLLERFLPNEKEITVEDFLNETSQNRRLTHSITEATIYTNLLSDFDQLERRRRYLKKRKKEEVFWQDGVQGKKYMELLELKARMDQIQAEIEALEIENLLLIHEEKMEIQDQLEKAQFWKEDFSKLKFQLIQQTGEPYSICCLGVYGPAVHLKELFRIYEKIIQAKGFTFTGHSIWFDANAKDEDRKYVRKALFDEKQDEMLLEVGFELEIRENLCFLYFQAEGGFVKWFNKNKVLKKYFISVQKGELEDFGTPDGVHRQRFFSQGHFRRKYHPTEGFHDSRYNRQVPSKHFAKEILALLDFEFERNITRQLTSTN